MTPKKWMTSLDLDNWKWIMEIKKTTGVAGSIVINELIRREREDRSGKFKAELRQMKLKSDLQRLNDKKMKLSSEEQELLKQLKSDKTASVTA